MFKFAENLLNNLDQTAQTTVQTALNTENQKNTKKNKHIKNNSFTTNHVSSISEKPKSATSISASNSSVNLTNPSNTLSSKDTSKSKHKNKPKKQDEDLFENFLNNSEKLEVPLAKTSSTASIDKAGDQGSSINEENVKFEVGSENNRSNNSEEKSPNESFEIKESTENLATSNKEDDPKNDDETRDGYDYPSQDSKNDDELNVYKEEIEQLNEEIKSLMKQIKTSQNDYQRARKKLENFQQSNSESDKIIRELRSREEDLTESIKTKDGQLGVLRVRFSEIESELMSKRGEINSIKSESERILNDYSNSSDIQSQAFETLKQKLKDLEHNLEREKELKSEAQKDYMSMQSKLEFEKQNLNENLQLIEKKLNDEKTKNSEINSQLKNMQSKLKSSSNNLKQELEDYKLKATKTLQAKDRIIAQFKDNKDNSNNDSENGSEGSSMKLIEFEELKGERDGLKDEVDSKISTIELLRAEINELDTQTSAEIEALKDEQRSLIEEQEEEKLSKNYLEQDLKNIRGQLDYAQEELYKQKSTANNRLGEREAEIEKLRSQLTTKSLGTTTEKELENRLHMLTENLIQKQTLIEALQSEKHSIFLQLERSEKRLQDYEKIMSSKNSVTLRMNDDDVDSQGKNQIFRESPYDHEVTKKVKRAASEIDKFGIRLGVFLKKYPIARIFVLFYMFLLHLWVVVVLFTYTPEAHDMNYLHKPNLGMPMHPLN